MASWRFLFRDLRTSALLGEPATVTTWTHNETLDPLAASWGATIAPRPDTFDGDLYRDLARIGRTEVVALRDGTAQFSGIVHAVNYDPARGTLQLTGGGLASYLNGFAQTDRLRFPSGTDQYDIARGLVDVVQDIDGGDIGIVTGTDLSGVTRKRVYDRFSGNTIGQLVNALSDVRNGFNWTIRVETDSGEMVRYLRLWYPRRGRTFNETGLRFRFPSPQVTGLQHTHRAPGQAVSVTAIGAGEGDQMLTATVTDTALVDGGWPAYRTTRAFKDVLNVDTLTEHAQREVDRLAGINSTVQTVQVNPAQPGIVFGSWDVGDDCELTVDDDPVIGGTTERRVTGHRWQIASHTVESLTVTLEQRKVEA